MALLQCNIEEACCVRELLPSIEHFDQTSYGVNSSCTIFAGRNGSEIPQLGKRKTQLLTRLTI